ncbi:uncharacterized protein [Paralichthys olivaceus]|uniref:uncharacterized protein n=1 Tax=Paralichthys olivaceus TaxID=8255 RepID=UPI003753030F
MKTMWLLCFCAGMHMHAISVALLAAQSVSRCVCVCGGRVSVQLEWVLLDAHLALLQRLVQQGECQDKAVNEMQSQVAKRCQTLTALIRLTSITPCQELLDMQERTCQLAVVTTPRDSRALCLLGLAQLAQYDSNPNSEKSREAITDACLSFQASIELEDKTQSGQPPEQLSRQKWWQDQQNFEDEKSSKQSKTQPKGVKGSTDTSVAKRAARRGRGGGAWSCPSSCNQSCCCCCDAPSPHQGRESWATRSQVSHAGSLSQALDKPVMWLFGHFY